MPLTSFAHILKSVQRFTAEKPAVGFFSIAYPINKKPALDGTGFYDHK